MTSAALANPEVARDRVFGKPGDDDEDDDDGEEPSLHVRRMQRVVDAAAMRARAEAQPPT